MHDYVYEFLSLLVFPFSDCLCLCLFVSIYLFV